MDRSGAFYGREIKLELLRAPSLFILHMSDITASFLANWSLSRA